MPDTKRVAPKLTSYFKLKGAYYNLVKGLNNFEVGGNWILHDNLNPSQTIILYLSTKILNLIYPNLKIYNSSLIRVKEDNKYKSYVISEIDEDLLKFNQEDCKVQNIHFSCLQSMCNIDGGVYEANGLEQAILTSLFLDGTNFSCSDYSVINNWDSLDVIYDDLIGNFVSIDSRNDQTILLSQTILERHYLRDKERIKELVPKLEDFEGDVFLKLYKLLPQYLTNKLNADNAIKAAEDILQYSNQIPKLVHEIFDDLRMNFKESDIISGFTLVNVTLSEYRSRDLTSKSLEQYITSLLMKNMENLNDFKNCTKAETYLKINDVSKLVDLLKDEDIISDPICMSFYRYPTKKTYIDFPMLHFSKLAYQYKYENDASEYFNKFWEHYYTTGDYLIESID